MEEVIAEAGFLDGFLIPAANKENLDLQLEIHKLQLEREQLVASLDDKNCRLTVVKNYLQNLRQDQEENRKLNFEYECQINAEDSSVKFFESQIRSLAAEKRDLEKKRRESKERSENYQQEKKRMESRLEQLRAQVQWDQVALETWSSAAVRVGDDHAVLQHFSQVDEAKYKEAELKRQKLRQELDEKRRKNEILAGDIVSLEHSLEKSAEMYRAQNKDRESVMEQWNGAAQILRQRDADIYRAMQEIGALRAQTKLRMAELEEHRTFCNNEERNIKEAEKERAQMEQEMQNNAANCRELEATVSDLTGQLSAARGSLTSAGRQTQALRRYCRRMTEEINSKRATCQRLEVSLEEMKLQVEQTKSQKSSADDRASQLENLKRQEEINCEKLAIERVKQQEKVRLLTEELARQRDVERQQRGSMSGLAASVQSMRQRIQQAQTEQKRQEEMLYKAEINCLQKDLAYKRMLGQADPENAERCEKKLAELEAEMLQTKEAQALLQRENYRLEQEFRRVVLALERDAQEQKMLREKRQELLLETEGGAKRVAAIRTSNQEGQVEENVVRLRVCHLEKAVKRVGGQLFSLDKQKLELEEAVKERSLEVEAQLEVLSVRKRALVDQLAALNANINASKLQIEQLEAKHELCMQSLGNTETGEPMTVTQMKIMAAQERYELQQEGDQLDRKIKRTEREITAMENNLRAVNAANTAYKGSLSRVPAEGPELQEMAELESSYVSSVEDLRRRRAELQELEEATARLKDSLQIQLEEEAVLRKEAQLRTGELAELQRRLASQNEKQVRATRQLRGLIKQIHGFNKKDMTQTLEEKDILLREIREQNQVALHMLGEAAAGIAEAAPVVTHYLRERGLALPVPTARRSTAGSSRASSVSGAALSSSCFTIDSLTLGEAPEEGPKVRRPSILKSDKKTKQQTEDTATSQSNLSQSIDIVDLLPQQKAASVRKSSQSLDSAHPVDQQQKLARSRSVRKTSQSIDIVDLVVPQKK